MGARLALQILTKRSVARAVLVSCGIATPEPGRQELDDTWARRFESEPWPSLIEAWNAQAVFVGRKNQLERNESDFDRQKLAAALRDWSPAVLHTNIRDIAVPTLWIAGEADTKYSDAARRASQRLPGAELWICPEAGHRVPWEQPSRFIERLRSFVS